jgi:CDP-glucose 4,6-dehydratase
MTLWPGRRVLLTGHTGFKGRWLALWLERLGAEVVGYSLDDGGDVRDGERVRAAAAGCDIVIHLAAQALLRRSFAEPVQTFDVNVRGTACVLDAARDARVVLVVTSDKCYRPREGGAPYAEDDPLGGKDPYSASKAAQEHVAQAYAATMGVPVSTARAGNVIGGGDWSADRLVPDLMRAALAGEPLLVRAPEAIRPWQHVLNPLSGYLRLIEALWEDPSHQGGWNFGPDRGDARTVRDVVARLRARWPEPLEVVEGDDAAGEATWLALDSTKAHERLGWRSVWDLDVGLDATVEWFLAHRAGEPERDIHLRQIEAFEAAVAAERP